MTKRGLKKPIDAATVRLAHANIRTRSAELERRKGDDGWIGKRVGCAPYRGAGHGGGEAHTYERSAEHGAPGVPNAANAAASAPPAASDLPAWSNPSLSVATGAPFGMWAFTQPLYLRETLPGTGQVAPRGMEIVAVAMMLAAALITSVLAYNPKRIQQQASRQS